MKNERVLFSMPTLRMNIKSVNINADSKYLGMHIHKEIELVRVERGKVLCTVNNKKIYLEQGECMLINRRVMHMLSFCGESADCTYIQIDTGVYAKELTPDAETYFSLFVSNDSIRQYDVFGISCEVNNIFENIKKEVDLQQSGYEPYIKAEIFHLVAFMCRNGFCNDGKTLEDKNEVAKILPAIKYADANYNIKLTLDEMSKVININKYYFCKLFKKATGATFVEYLNFVRLYNAEDKLLNTDNNISEIAFECGFSSIQHFNKLFREYKGCTPREYRKMSKN